MCVLSAFKDRSTGLQKDAGGEPSINTARLYRTILFYRRATHEPVLKHRIAY